MDEQNISVPNNLHVPQVQEQSTVKSPRFNTKRALIAFLDDQEKRTLLLSRPPLQGEGPTQLEESIVQYNTARASRPRYVPTNPIVPKDYPTLDQVRTRPDVVNTFNATGMDWRVVMINLKQILSFQPIVRIDNLDERINAASQDPDLLLQLCLPTSIQIEASFETNGLGHTIITSSPNIVYTPTQLPVLVGGQAMPTPAFVPQLNSGLLNVVHYQGRYFLRDGYHRAAGLLRDTTKSQVIVPCLVEAQALNQTGWKPGMISEAVLLSDHPPYVSDFWDDAVSCTILQKAKRKVFRMSLDVFEIDEV